MVSKENFGHYCCVCGIQLPCMKFERYLEMGYAVKLDDGTLRYFCVRHRGCEPVEAGSMFVKAGEI